MTHMFTKRLTGVIIVLLILIAPLLFSSVASGGRVSDIELFEDPTNQRVELTYTTTLESIDSISISPNINFIYDFTNNIVEIKFLEFLTYETTYTISIDTTDSRGKTSEQMIDFTTSDITLFHLLRDEDGVDQIFQADVGGESEVVFSADRIITYAVGKSDLAIITEESDGTLEASFKNNTVTLPADTSRVRSFEGAQDNDQFLLVIQLEDSSHRSFMLTESDFIEILNDTVIYAQFAADQKSIIYQDSERNMFIIDNELQESPVSIGTIDELVQVLANGSGFFVKQDGAYTTIDAIAGSIFVAPESAQTAAQAVSFNDQTGYYGVEPNYTDRTLNYDIVIIENTGTSEVMDTLDDDIFIYDVLISPNNQYLFTSQSSAPVVFDNIDPHWQPQDSPVTTVRDSSGQIVETLSGSLIRWRL